MDCNLLSQVKSCSDVFPHMEQMDAGKVFLRYHTISKCQRSKIFPMLLCPNQEKTSVVGSLVYFLDLSLT